MGWTGTIHRLVDRLAAGAWTGTDDSYSAACSAAAECHVTSQQADDSSHFGWAAPSDSASNICMPRIGVSNSGAAASSSAFVCSIQHKPASHSAQASLPPIKTTPRSSRDDLTDTTWSSSSSRPSCPHNNSLKELTGASVSDSVSSFSASRSRRGKGEEEAACQQSTSAWCTRQNQLSRRQDWKRDLIVPADAQVLGKGSYGVVYKGLFKGVAVSACCIQWVGREGGGGLGCKCVLYMRAASAGTSVGTSALAPQHLPASPAHDLHCLLPALPRTPRSLSRPRA